MLQFSLLALALPIAVVHALSNEQIGSVFPTSRTDLRGAAIELPQFTLNVVTNSTHALFSMNATNSRPFEVGWMAIATGTSMRNSDYFIAWPNPAPATGPSPTPWTLSHRNAVGQSQPLVASTVAATSTAAYFTYLPALSTTDPASTFTVVSFLRLLTPPDSYPSTATKNIARARTDFIYASSSRGPSSSAEDAVLTQHDQANRRISLDLSAPISLVAVVPGATDTTAPPTSGVTSTVADTSRTMDDMKIIAHAVFASLAFLIVMPLAIIIARFFRHTTWFPAHAALQVISLVFVVIAFALAVNVSTEHFYDTHTRLGLAVFILVVFQVAVGATAHRTKHGVTNDVSDAVQPMRRVLPTLTTPGKSPVRLFHIALGILILALGWININEGFEQWPIYSDAKTNVPTGVIVVYAILVAFWALAYVAGWVKEFLSSRKIVAREHSQSEEKTVL